MSSSAGTRERRTRYESIGEFERKSEIGKGSFATVYSGVHKTTGRLVAIKSVNLGKLNKKLKDNLQGEISILKELQHPHIVRLLDCQQTASHIHLVMEYCQLGDLSYFIKKRETLAANEATAGMARKYPNPRVGGLNEVVTRHFLKQLTSALRFLRGKNLIHRDVKPQNLLLTPSKQYTASHLEGPLVKSYLENPDIPRAGVASLPMLKVADFGFARSLPSTSLAETLCGSPLYMAPEILRYEKYDAKADLWSVGTVLYEMVVGRPPFRAANHVELLRRIEQGQDVIRFIEHCEASRPMKELIRALLKRNPVERMSFENFFNHEVITGPIPGLVGEDKLEKPAEPETTTKPLPAASRLPRQAPMELNTHLNEQIAEAMASSPSRDRPKRNSVGHGIPVPSLGTSPGTRIAPLVSSNHASTPRRPAIQGPSATAPNMHHQPRATAMERAPSGDRQLPGSPLSQVYTGGDQITSAPAKNTPTQAEVAAWDVQEEREYVVINTRSVEVNALADQMAADPRLREEPKSTVMVRRATTQGHPGSVTGAIQPQSSRAVQIAQGKTRTDHQRRGSYEARSGGQSPSSATSALGKAIAGASLRLFGVSYDAQKHLPNIFGGRGISPPQFQSPFPVYPISGAGISGLIADGKHSNAPEDEDAKAVMTVEDNATRSDVVYGFAEVKYRQLIPLAPSMDHGLGGNAQDEAAEDDDEGLTPDATVALSEEALVLYVKALSLLAKAMDYAQSWWVRRNRGEIITVGSPRGNHVAAGNRINSAVQWIRVRFNEVLEKAEFVRAKLLDAQKQLPEDHPGHPSNHNTSSKTVGASTDGVVLSSGVTAEKLMYDRALDMSRSAAINEISNTDLVGCEISYVTAIRMLEAVLENVDDTSSSSSAGNRDDQGEVNGIDLTDRESVKKILTNIRARLHSLRKKMAIIAKSQPSSLPQRLSRPSSTYGSGGTSTPMIVSTPPK